ncbi:iron ABC transporter permease [Leptolyngbya sp. CCY15150]|uniref:FecCD family ABC transporter permease n=1 Tax=Leptolyngbya sp. CCY15150 TaxID=2767772 RepID=UPI0019526FF5|nr:iron ABC transporter permease [Leptolyngbya sp. CCY15150]
MTHPHQTSAVRSPQWLILRSRFLPLSFRIKAQVPAVVLGLGGLVVALLVISVAHGEYPVPPLEVVRAILGGQTQNPDYLFVVNSLRLPRVLTALLAGMGLAIAGTITQGLLRNPLASPDIIGINNGAALAAVICIIVVPSVPTAILPIAAFSGGLMVAGLVYGLSWNSGTSPIRLVLVGIGFSLMTGAITNILITFGNLNQVSQALIWLTGSVYGRTWDQVWALAPWLMVSLPIVLLMARDLNGLNLGDDTARGLGIALEWRRGILLLVAVLLSGASVATAGTIGFVGFIAPHISRQLVGPSHEGVILVSAVVGACLVMAADLLGRSIFAPIELPCGLITSLLGAPYFLMLMMKQRPSVGGV